MKNKTAIGSELTDNQKVSDILERISDAFVALDNNWCYTYMNKKAGEIFNRNPAKMIGKHIWSEFPEGIGQPFHLAYEKAMIKQEYVYLEEYYPPYDKWFENHIYPSPEGISIFFKDITERKKYEEALHQERSFIESLINASPDIIYIYDIEERRNIYANEGVQKNLGYSEAEIKAMGDQLLPRLMHPDDLSAYLQHTYPKYATLADKQIFIHEFRMQDKQGNWHWLYCRESIYLRNPDGTPRQIFGITTDITERKIAEEKLLFHEQQLSLIYDTVSDPLFLLQVEEGFRFKFLSINHTFLAATGLKEDQVTNRYVDEIIPQPSLDLVLEKYREAIQTGKTVNWEEVTQYPTGIKTGIVSITPVFNAEGQCIRMVGTVHDITALKKIEIETLKEKEISDSIINSLPGIFYLYTKEGSFLRWNKNFETVTGYSPAEIKQMHPLDFFDDPEKPLLTEKIKSVFVNGEDQVEAEFLNKSKKKIPYFFTGRTIEYEGGTCLMGVGIDISERTKAQEESRKATEQLRQLTVHLQNIREEERKRIGREIHDELGQQLTAIKMDVVWIDNKTHSEDAVIKSKLKNIISLLDGSNLSIRKILNELRMGLYNAGLVDLLEWQSRQFTETTGIQVSLKKSEPVIKVNEQMTNCIFRVYQEALTNITRHAKAKNVTASLVLIENEIRLKIEDDGKGFNEEESKNRNSFGILGMKERVSALNGRFELISSPGKGTRICVTIPLQ